MFIAAFFTIAKSRINPNVHQQMNGFTYNGILFSLKKEGNFDMLYHGSLLRTLCEVK